MQFEHSYAYEPGRDGKPGRDGSMGGPIPSVHQTFDSVRKLEPVVRSEAFDLIDNNVSLGNQISTQIKLLSNKLSIVLVPPTTNPGVDKGSVSPNGKTDLENKLIECNMRLHSVLLELEELSERVSL